jgi:hypothetical protein
MEGIQNYSQFVSYQFLSCLSVNVAAIHMKCQQKINSPTIHIPYIILVIWAHRSMSQSTQVKTTIANLKSLWHPGLYGCKQPTAM